MKQGIITASKAVYNGEENSIEKSYGNSTKISNEDVVKNKAKNKSVFFSEKLTKRRRTYFFSIKESKTGDLYLNVTERTRTADKFSIHKIMVFEEDVDDFAGLFDKTLITFKKLKDSNQSHSKAYSVEKIRNIYKKAYAHWEPEDDKKLELLYNEGKNIDELSKIFERNNGAISSRIKKLNLNEKTGIK